MKNIFSVYKGLPRDIYALFAANIVNRIGSFIVPLMTLILTEKIGLSKAQAGVFSTIAMLAQIPFLLLGGKLTDSLGSKKTIVLFSLLGASAYLVCALVPLGLPAAALIALASNLCAASFPALRSIVAEVTAPEQRKQAYSLSYLGVNLGFTLGPVFAGLMFESHLQLLFVLNAFTTLLFTLFILFYVKPRGAQKAEESSASAAPSGRVGAFLRGNPVLVAFTLAMLVYEFCYVQWTFLLPLQMVDLFAQQGVKFYSLLASTNGLTVILLTPVITALTRKLPPLKSILIGGAIYAASFSAFAFNRTMAHFVIAVVAITVGEVFAAYNVNCYIAERTPPAYIGRVNSLCTVMTGTGVALGPAAMGSLLFIVPLPRIWLVVSAIMAMGAAAMFAISRRDRAAHPASARETPAPCGEGGL